MRAAIAAIFALAAASPLAAGVPTAPDLSIINPIAGSWSYAATADGSEATFSDGGARPQLSVRCTRATREVTFAKLASAAAPFLFVWTSSVARNVPATYDPQSSRVSATLPAFDPLLDAVASSRGRVGFSTSGLAALVVPPWAELARVIEDCRV